MTYSDVKIIFNTSPVDFAIASNQFYFYAQLVEGNCLAKFFDVPNC